MMSVYNLFIRVYAIIIFISSFFNQKARLYINGRKHWRSLLKNTLNKSDNQRIWFHCASLGEFEQARNLIEKIKQKISSAKIVLTFSSPSGYEIRKNYEFADYVFYLPVDTSKNAKDFIDLIKPKLAVFVKYEFWHYYLHTLKEREVETFLISAAFRREQAFFKWYGDFFREMLQCFTMMFVQDDESKKLLGSIGLSGNVVIAGDTRYDRVYTIAQDKKTLPLVKDFLQNKPALIVGSSWQDDEKIIKESFSSLPDDWKLIIAPHEISRTGEVKKLFPNALLYSQLEQTKNIHDYQVLIINNIGLLSSLYAYGKVAFIGGGFQKGGIHNILEPAVFGLPVVFGPIYKKFVEAATLVNKELCFPVNNAGECKNIFLRLSTNENYYKTLHEALLQFMQQNIGATDKVFGYVEYVLMK